MAKAKMPMKGKKVPHTDMGFAEAQFPKKGFASKSKVAKLKKKPSASKYK